MEWLLLGIAVLLIAATALFVAAEFSLVTVERGTVEAGVAADERGAGGVLSGLRTLSTQLSGAQLGITVTTLLVGFLAQPSLASLLSAPLEAAGVGGTTADGLALALALFLATGVSMVFGELVPKNLAIALPFATAKAVVPFQRGFTWVTHPLIRLFNGNANWLLRRLGVEPQEELASARSAEELQSLLRRSAAAGTLEGGTARLLSRSLNFGERTAGDVLTPRGRVDFVERSTSVADVVELARTTGHSRFPVTGDGGSDDVVGVVTLRVLLRVPEDDRARTTAASVMDPPLVVPETVQLDELLVQLRNGSHLALVVDEYGGTAGVVTIEDLVEELVGEVEDEHDSPDQRVRNRPDGSLLLSGLLRPDELRELGIPADDDSDYDTLGGLVVDELGRIAVAGDTAEVGGWQLTVRQMDGMRIDLVEATPPAEPADATGRMTGATHE